MKIHALGTALALALVLPLAACDKHDTDKATNTVKDAEAKTGDKIVEMKDKFVHATEDEMDELSKKYDELKVKASNASADAKAAAQDALDNFKTKKNELMKKLEDARKDSDGSKFEEMKERVKEGMADLRRRLDEALAKLK